MGSLVSHSFGFFSFRLPAILIRASILPATPARATRRSGLKSEHPHDSGDFQLLFLSFVDFRIGWITDSFEHFSARIVVRFDLMTPYYTTARACLKEQRYGYGCCKGNTQVL
ncbi:hypothetical protein SDJN03_23586, partial [Cucurbita argyrosperma subsp. sororia]